MNERNDLEQENGTEIAATSLQPMSFVDILDGIFSIYRSHFRLFLGIIVVYFVFGFVLDHISVYALTRSASIANIMVSVLISIVSFLITLLVAAGLIYASARVYLDKDITSQAALKQGWRRFLPLLGCTLLYYLGVGGLAITILGIPFAIYFAFRWGLCSLPVLVEESTARNGLRRSTELVKGTWWRVCGIMLAISVITFMIAFILQTSYVLLLSSLSGGTGTEDTTLWETLRRLYLPTPNDVGWAFYSIQHLGTSVIAGLTMPIGSIGSTLLYFDLRIRKEAFDIERMATSAGENQSG